jgi:ribonuclease P protein component
MASGRECRREPAGSSSSAAAPRAVSASRRSALVQRRNRLSRSRDFDAVYRQGRSVSTRFLVLYAFAREDGDQPRLGSAFPRKVGGAVVRNRIKRQLREIWGARLERLPANSDFVLVARPGLAEAAEAQGFDWLGERVDEVLSKAKAVAA